MGHEELLSTLKTLHSQLSTTGEVDAETQAMLQTVTDDLQKLLERHNAPDAVAETDDSLSTRLRDSLIELEVRHPRLGGLLERITDGLANMGI